MGSSLRFEKEIKSWIPDNDIPGSSPATKTAGKLRYEETCNEGVDYIAVVGDFISVVLADSVIGACFVADCVAIVDTVSDCGDSGGGVFGAYKVNFISACKNIRQSGKIKKWTPCRKAKAATSRGQVRE